jgi:hypothetical protein
VLFRSFFLFWNTEKGTFTSNIILKNSERLTMAHCF